MRNRISDLIWFGVEEGKETSCMVPLEGVNGITVEARCSKDCALNVVTDSGEIMPLDHGRIVRWSGPTTGYSAVEIVADTGFWYAVQKSSKWYEIPDPTPMAIELTQTKEDIIKSLIDERLRAYTVRMKMEKNLTEDEKDELILDIAHDDFEPKAGCPLHRASPTLYS
jgi:hypothetical protein